jgi:hypothetical protein
MALSDILTNIYNTGANFITETALPYVFDFDFNDPNQTGLAEDVLGLFQTTNPTTGQTTFNPQAIAGGLGALLPFVLPDSFTDPQTPPVGYQGGIPQYKATRTRLPLDDTNRRPGSSGRRYFTDTKFTPMSRGGLAGGIANILPKPRYSLGGGISNMESRYLGTAEDGMADTIPATIDGKDPAALAGGEFVVAADVVSGLGNGNSDAGAKELYGMMDRVRRARTGTTQQGKEINPRQMMRA